MAGWPGPGVGPWYGMDPGVPGPGTMEPALGPGPGHELDSLNTGPAPISSQYSSCGPMRRQYSPGPRYAGLSSVSRAAAGQPHMDLKHRTVLIRATGDGNLQTFFYSIS